MLTCAGAGSRRGTISSRKFICIADSGRSPLSNTCLKSRAGVELRSMMGLYGTLSAYGRHDICLQDALFCLDALCLHVQQSLPMLSWCSCPYSFVALDQCGSQATAKSVISPLFPERREAVDVYPRIFRIIIDDQVGTMIWFYSHVESIFLSTPINVPFSSAAATLSLSPSCLLTASSVLCVPFLMRTSMRKRGGRACSSRTRTPKPMTVASEQCVMVGVISTTTVLMEDCGETGGRM
jgi:hypothetical protein